MLHHPFIYKSMILNSNNSKLKNNWFKPNQSKAINSDMVRTNDTGISCGVTEITNLDTTILHIRNKFKPEFQKEALKILLNQLKKDIVDEIDPQAFLIMSTTVSLNVEYRTRLLDSVCSSRTRVRKNPNSGNNIKIWIY